MRRDYAELRRFPSLKRTLVDLYLDLDKITNYVSDLDTFDEELSEFEKLVVLMEDRRYFRHTGIDWLSVARVLLKSIVGKSRGGASTIEMQFVRRATGRYERTVARKLREMLLAKLIGFHMSKALVLRSYLACAYFGYRLRGANEASHFVFDRPVWQLSREQSAFLAALMVYPFPKNPTPAWQANVERRAAYGLALLGKLHKSLDDVRVA